MSATDLQNAVTKETLIQIMNRELAGMNLTTNEYIQLANSILDAALEKKQHNGSAAERYAADPVMKIPARTGEVGIRPLDPDRDMALLRKWTSDRAGKEFLLSRLENTSKNVDGLIADGSNIFGIVCDPSEQPIGIVGFLNYDRPQRKAELRKLIGDTDARGMGYGKKATRLWLSYGIHGLKLRKIYLYTFDTNLRNIRINEELGFKLEGIYRAENIIDGIAKDIIRMGLLIE
jgi:RimJ/RimL family protein N-acetyltransferase